MGKEKESKKKKKKSKTRLKKAERKKKMEENKKEKGVKSADKESSTPKSKEDTDENIKVMKKESEEDASSVDSKQEKIVRKRLSGPPTRPRPKDHSPKVKKPEKTVTDSSARKIMPSKPVPSISQSKSKKDENNKKVMETRKAAVLAKNKKKVEEDEKHKTKKIVPRGKTVKSTKQPLESEEGTKVNEKIVTEKVTEAIASGEIDDSRLVKDEDEDKESVVEKDQIEEMETSPLENK